MILILKLDCIGYIPAKNYELFKIILKKMIYDKSI